MRKFGQGQADFLEMKGRGEEIKRRRTRHEARQNSRAQQGHGQGELQQGKGKQQSTAVESKVRAGG